MKKLIGKLDNTIILGKCKMQVAKEKAKDVISKAKKGDIAFEYVIILVIMAGVIFFGWNLLGNMVLQKINEISGVLNNTHAY